MARKPEPAVGARDLGPRGRRLWAATTEHYELDEHESALLTEACRTADVLELLDAAVRRDGPLVDTPAGQRAHPGAVEARQQRLTLARLLAALRLPDDVTEQLARPQRRGGARGVYAVPSRSA